MPNPSGQLAVFDVNQLVGNAGAVYLGEALMMGSIKPNEKQIQQTIRAGIANGIYQAGFLVGPVAKFLGSLGIQETQAIQAVFQGLAMAGMDTMMPRTAVGYQVSFVEGVIGTYAGNALAKSMKPIN